MEELEMEVFANFNCTPESLGPKRDSLYVVIPVIIIYVIIFVTGTIGNVSTCIVINRNKSMHTATNFYLFSLAVSDLLLLLSGVPQEIYLIWSKYPYIFGSTFCFLRGLFAETSANATVLTITSFTVERYLAICHPFLSHTMSKLSRVVKFILAIWFLAICLAIPQAMQFGIIKGDGDCTMCQLKNPLFKHTFEISTFLFFVVPMTLITVLYVLIGVRLKSSRMMKKRNSNARVHSKSSKKVLKMLVAVVVAFFICWAPFHTQRLFSIHYSRPDETIKKIYEIITYISGVLFYTSATVNPILYNIMSMKFREAFKETFTKCCGLGFQHKKPQRSYSVLSRSNIRGPDSGDSAVHTHTTLTHKSSIESYNGLSMSGRRCNGQKASVGRRELEIEEPPLGEERDRELIFLDMEATTLQGDRPKTIISRNDHLPKRRNKIWRFFEGFAKKTLDNGKLQPSLKDNTPSYSPCDISNSSLKDVETGAIEDELSAYMKEVHQREYYS